MKYIAVSKNVEGVLTIYIYNRFTKEIHSSWPTLAQAQEVAFDLNRTFKRAYA
jgi:hypothetical protein